MNFIFAPHNVRDNASHIVRDNAIYIEIELILHGNFPNIFYISQFHNPEQVKYINKTIIKFIFLLWYTFDLLCTQHNNFFGKRQ